MDNNIINMIENKANCLKIEKEYNYTEILLLLLNMIKKKELIITNYMSKIDDGNYEIALKYYNDNYSVETEKKLQYHNIQYIKSGTGKIIQLIN
jgi:hypothetical protein